MADVRIVGQGTPGILAAADQAYGFGGEKNLFAVPVIFAAQDGEGDFFFAKHLVEAAIRASENETCPEDYMVPVGISVRDSCTHVPEENL